MVSMKQKASMAAGALLVAAGMASADVSQTIFSIHASNSRGVDTWSFQLPDGVTNPFAADGTFDWDLRDYFPNGITLPNTGVQLTLAEIHLVDDPVVFVNFSVNNTAGTDSTVNVTSPLLSFASIANAIGNASASVTLTDPTGNGASLTPVGGAGYTAFYNGGAPGTGSTFASLFGSALSIAPTGNIFGVTETWTADSPAPGVFGPFGGAVADASASWMFRVSDGDLASGTSTYEIIPTPGSVSLLALGIAAGIRRRRR